MNWEKCNFLETEEAILDNNQGVPTRTKVYFCNYGSTLVDEEELKKPFEYCNLCECIG